MNKFKKKRKEKKKKKEQEMSTSSSEMKGDSKHELFYEVVWRVHEGQFLPWYEPTFAKPPGSVTPDEVSWSTP